ncbi:kinase-like domain-containing protein, partial [Hygrophoropsis aurantiaca]
QHQPEITDSLSDGEFVIEVDTAKLASGLTKHMYRLTLNDVDYAAKRFYNVGGAPGHQVMKEENQIRLQEEIGRQVILKDLVEEFSKRSKELSVSVCDLRVMDSFLLRVCQGADEGLMWLVDPLLPSTNVVKYSGTVQAGANHDIFGQTCDALAHFSLDFSDGGLVPVDIQGIRIARVIGGVRGMDELALMDVMTHTFKQTSGLGDNGQDGINQFRSQHCCNTICEQLGLEPIQNVSPKRSLPITSQPDPDRLSSTTSTPSTDTRSHAIVQHRRAFVNAAGEGGVDHEGPTRNMRFDLAVAPLATLGPFLVHPVTFDSTDSDSESFVLMTLNPCVVPSLKGQRDTIYYHEVFRYVVASGWCHDFLEFAAKQGVTVNKFSVARLSIEQDTTSSMNWISAPRQQDTWETASCSGMKRPSSGDSLLTETLHAFSHHMYIAGSKVDAYVDLQYCIPPSDSESSAVPEIVYFKTHTSNGSFFFGDRGIKGVQQFVSSHCCNKICIALALDPLIKTL